MCQTDLLFRLRSPFKICRSPIKKRAWSFITSRGWLTLAAAISGHSLCVAAPLATSLEVRVAHNNQAIYSTRLSFSEPMRLDSAVMQTLEQAGLNTQQVEWPSAGLFDLSHAFLFKRDVLLKLADQQSSAPPPQQALWASLIAQLRQAEFAKRLFISVDPDWTRIAPQHNPRLNGSWLLTLNSKSTQVSVYGAVNQPGDVIWHNRLSAKDYAQAAGLIDEQISEIVVIQPDGIAQKHAVAYWNQDFNEVAPGAIVYVPLPLKRAFFDPTVTDADLNQLVIELLRNRLPL
ncbi:TPA: capsule biosynthesis GfcC family protein [Vibrio cholerae]